MIRSFLYLDSQKLRSISSQLFEGVTNYVLHSEGERKEDSEEQKAPFTSGRILGDIFSKEKSSSEMRFLEDHAYSIFESRISELSMLEESGKPDFDPNSDKTFFKITANLRLNDLAATMKMFNNFNEIGRAFARMQLMMERGGPSSSKAITEDEVNKYAAKINLHLDKKFLESVSKLIDFGMSDLLEANFIAEECIFSAPMKREFLRERADMILYKYSRVTQQSFSVVGMVTQRGSVAGLDTVALPDVSDADGIKAAMRTLALHLQNVEQFFVGPLTNEIVLDPIAIYSSI